MLKQVAGTLNRYNVTYWLDSGTLLAAIRDRRLIPWDNDIDLGVWNDDAGVLRCPDGMLGDLAQQGFQCYVLTNKVVVEKLGIPVNVTTYRLDGERATKALLSYRSVPGMVFKVAWWVLSVRDYNRLRLANALRPRVLGTHLLLTLAAMIPRTKRRALADSVARASARFGGHWTVKAIPAHFFRTFHDVSFYDGCFPAPAAVEDYLTYRYGEAWTPPHQALGYDHGRWGGYWRRDYRT